MGFLGPGVFENDGANDFAQSETNIMAYLLDRELSGPLIDPESSLVRARFLLGNCQAWGSAPHSRNQGMKWLDLAVKLAESEIGYPEYTDTVRQTFADLAEVGKSNGSDDWRFVFLNNRSSLPTPRGWAFSPADLAQIPKMLMAEDEQIQIAAFWKIGAALDEPSRYPAHEVEDGLLAVADACLRLPRKLPASVRGACPYAIRGIMAWLCYLDTPKTNQFLVAERERIKGDALVYSFRACLRLMPPEESLDAFRNLMRSISPDKLRETEGQGMKFPDVLTDPLYLAFMDRSIADRDHDMVYDFIRPGDVKAALFLFEFQRDRIWDDECGFVRRALAVAPAEVISEMVGILESRLKSPPSSKVPLPQWLLQAMAEAFENHVAYARPLVGFVSAINSGYSDKSRDYLQKMNRAFERFAVANPDVVSEGFN